MTPRLHHSVAAILFALTAILCGQTSAQSVPFRFQQLDKNADGTLDAAEAGKLGFFKPADVNGDGLVTTEEAQDFARKSASPPAPGPKRSVGMEGDGAAPVFHWPVAPVKTPESECPVQIIEATATDGRASRAWWRKPKGDEPFPAILFIHGGLTQFPEASLRRHLTDNPVITRFLATGYAVVMATFRTYERDVQSRGPIEDVRAVLHQTAKLPGVDSRRIALFGGSGGGSIALELGGDPEVRAVVAGEPATVLYTGMLTTGEYGPRLEMMANPEKFFTPELRGRTLEKLKTVRAPVLILHGDRHDLHKLNKPLILPLMKEAGLKVEYREYAGYGHGFYFGGGGDRWGRGADETVVEKVVGEVSAFLGSAMPGSPGTQTNSDRLSDLQRYRLWAARETAVRRQDMRAIEKLAAISRRVATSNDWSPAHDAELRELLRQLEARLGVTAPGEVPSHLKPDDYLFAVARRERLDVRFANADGLDAGFQSLDVHAPAEGKEHPIIVFIHGGGMKGGDKAHPGITVLKPDFFIARGYVFASINYRLAPAQKHPAQAEDTAAAIAWLHDHAAEFGGDPTRIFLIGISAGGQLAALVSTNERFLAKHGKCLDAIKGAVILDIGSFDIPTLMEQAGEKAPEMYRYTFRDGGTREDWIDCSPFYHVRRGKGIPPMLLYYVAGREHHAAENRRFAERLRAEGYEASVLAAEGKSHLSIELEIGLSGDVPTAEILRFLKQQCRNDEATATAARPPAWVTAPVTAPRVQFRTFDSAAAKTKVSYHLYSPAIYDREPERGFPVLYWLHGTGGGLRGVAPLSEFFDRAIEAGKIPPMLVVFPNGLATSMWCDSKDGAVPMETMLTKELVPHIDATFRTVAKPEARILEGFSMGGYGAARLGFKYLHVFGAVSILAGGPLDVEFAGPRAAGNPTERERILKATFGGDLSYFKAQSPISIAEHQADAVRGKVRMRMAVGSRDDTEPLNRAYSERLTKLDIPHTFTVVPDAGHDTLALFSGLGESNWEFYREAFATLSPGTKGAPSGSTRDPQNVKKP